jgi:hypothetical protein
MAKEPRQIAPEHLVGRIANYLAALGFEAVHKSETGSRYLRLPKSPFRIRISDHQWSNFSRDRNRHVIRNVVLQPIPEAEVYLLAFELALRFTVQEQHRRRPR